MTGGSGLRTAEEFYKAGGIDTRPAVQRTKLVLDVLVDGTRNDAEDLAGDIFQDARVIGLVVSIEEK